jgi:hypothetical protein
VKFLYKPVGLVFGVLAGMVAGALFKRFWRLVADEEHAPKPLDLDRSWREITVAAALHGAVFGAVKAIVDRAGATGFAQATGVWPGDTDSH